MMVVEFCKQLKLSSILRRRRSRRCKTTTTTAVPSSLILFNCFSLIQIYATTLLLFISLFECNYHQNHELPPPTPPPTPQLHKHHHNRNQHHHIMQPSWPESSIQKDDYNFDTLQADSRSPYSSPIEPTPELNLANLEYLEERHQDFTDLISPSKVFEEHQIHQDGQNSVTSPVFDLHSMSLDQQHHRNVTTNGLNSPTESNNNNNFLEFGETGSGSNWEAPPFDEGPVRSNEISPAQPDPKAETTWPTSDIMTQRLGQQTMVHTPDERFDRAPMLMRRIPKLVALAGQFWRYTIPADTFADEDGDLRKLRTSLINPILQQLNNNNNFHSDDNNSINQISDANASRAQSQYFHWLQYDQNSQTIYGFPTDNDTGRYEYSLMVVDHWNLTSNETIEITVRQHQSTRAFTHAFQINDILWNSQKYPSMVVVLLDLTKRINLGLQSDFSSSGLILKSYNFRKIQQISGSTGNNSSQSSDGFSLLTIEWSNASILIHPCDLTKLEHNARLLIDTSYPNWSLETGQRNDLIPSQNLIKALEPDFRPRSIDIRLLGACEHNESLDNNNNNNNNIQPLVDRPKVRMKIGKLNWMLGEPIMYKIPDEVFEADGSRRDSRNLSLTLHTIEGSNLETNSQYSFLEFDRENRIVFGLPYDSVQHTGPRELLLTATHPITNQTIREVFVINIERQDLTTINNRAFQVSLYFMVRSTLFGPRQRVALSQQIAKSMGHERIDFSHDQDISQLTVIEIQKFSFTQFKYNVDNSPAAYAPSIWNDATKFQRVEDAVSYDPSINDLVERPDDMMRDMNFLYKLVWTNESIGHDGNCPVEVIRVNILEALEHTMFHYLPELEINRIEDTKNASMKFYERLRSFFEPDFDLVHLRFEPSNACHNDLEVHDAGNEQFADLVESSIQLPAQESFGKNLTVTNAPPKLDNLDGAFNSDEYWSIVVLVILVVALIFVVMMFFMGMHTYKINQEKKFELQVKLAQARQNSMFYSSLMLADQAADMNGFIRQPIVLANMAAKPMHNHHDNDDRSSRKPVILENEKQYWRGNNPNLFKQTASNYNGQTIQTVPLRPNMTFTLDSIASSLQDASSNNMFASDPMRQINIDDGRRSMTLNRRQATMNQAPRYMPRHTSMNRINHSQSILTVASLAPSLQLMPHNQTAHVPIMYTPLPVVCESSYELPRESV